MASALRLDCARAPCQLESADEDMDMGHGWCAPADDPRRTAPRPMAEASRAFWKPTEADRPSSFSPSRPWNPYPASQIRHSKQRAASRIGPAPAIGCPANPRPRAAPSACYCPAQCSLPPPSADDELAQIDSDGALSALSAGCVCRACIGSLDEESLNLKLKS